MFFPIEKWWFFEGFKCWRFIIFPLDLYWEIRLSGTTEPVVVVFKCSQCKHMTFGAGWCWCLELLKVTGIDSESSLANGFLVSGMQKTACPGLHDWHLQHNMLHPRIKESWIVAAWCMCRTIMYDTSAYTLGRIYACRRRFKCTAHGANRSTNTRNIHKCIMSCICSCI